MLAEISKELLAGEHISILKVRLNKHCKDTHDLETTEKLLRYPHPQHKNWQNLAPCLIIAISGYCKRSV